MIDRILCLMLLRVVFVVQQPHLQLIRECSSASLSFNYSSDQIVFLLRCPIGTQRVEDFAHSVCPQLEAALLCVCVVDVVVCGDVLSATF